MNIGFAIGLKRLLCQKILLLALNQVYKFYSAGRADKTLIV